MDKLTYFIEALHLQLETEPEEGLMLWSQLFDQAREAWQTSLCRLLLRQLKATALRQRSLKFKRHLNPERATPSC